MSLEEADFINHTHIGIKMDRESDIEKMMNEECPYCDIEFMKISTVTNHYKLKHDVLIPSN